MWPLRHATRSPRPINDGALRLRRIASDPPDDGASGVMKGWRRHRNCSTWIGGKKRKIGNAVIAVAKIVLSALKSGS